MNKQIEEKFDRKTALRILQDLSKQMYPNKSKFRYIYLDDCPKDNVVLTREEYAELINLQRTHAEDLTNAIQSYEESKADLKLEYDNHIKNLEKIIDRQSNELAKRYGVEVNND